jgi:hypothetical protein
MDILELTGVVQALQPVPHVTNGGVLIGDTNVVAAAMATFPGLSGSYYAHEDAAKPRLTFLLAYGGEDTCYVGPARAYEGDDEGWSSWTPGIGPKLEIHEDSIISADFVARLRELEGELVHLRIDDGS